jgi:hypothetical protein
MAIIRTVVALAVIACSGAQLGAAETATTLQAEPAGTVQHIDVRAEAAKIDALVLASLASHQQKPNAPLGSDAFLRRIYLDGLGRIPTIQEAIDFRNQEDSDKRQQLIHRLLASEGHVSREFNWWADYLRVESQPMKRYPGEPYIDWVKSAVRDNLPYDKLVTSLITASGPVMERGNGATGYYLRDAGMAMDNMSFTVQAFLGTRVGCAQCHDHPFDKWTRMQYMQMSAFTANVVEGPDPTMLKEIRRLARSQGAPGEGAKKGLQLISRSLLLEVRSPAKDTVPLPKDYQYPNGKPNQPVSAHTLFGTDITPAPGEDPRVAYARWLTSTDNPRFTLVIANRLWKKVMGLGVIEPVDNLMDNTVPSNADLMAHLTQLMKDVGYDTRLYQEVLLNTRTYQSEATATAVNPGDDYWFPGPVLRRMSAEQVWDSLLTLMMPDVDLRKGFTAEGIYESYDENKDKTPEELVAMVTAAGEGLQKRAELLSQLKDLMAKYPDQQSALKDPQVLALRQQLQELNNQGAGKAKLKNSGLYQRGRMPPEADRRWAGFPRDYVRASELPSPAPPGHFLRDFGQSDRQLIDNSNPAPAVPQALTLLNGFVDQHLLDPRSLLMKTLQPLQDNSELVRSAYLAILTREPSPHELSIFSSAKDPGDLVWTLVNSREFLFLR